MRLLDFWPSNTAFSSWKMSERLGTNKGSKKGLWRHVYSVLLCSIERRSFWRHVTMLTKFVDHNNKELKQRHRWRQRELETSNRFILAKQQLCTCITLFCMFLSRRCRAATWNFLILRTRFTQKFPFSFSKLRCGPYGFNPRKFRQHLTN